jgi:hypothetical protein
LVTEVFILQMNYSLPTSVSSENEAGPVEFSCFSTLGDEVKLSGISK